ncbi:MAG: hypothetical protein J7K64_08305 [Bacteroidales bacterium]|nr:hypothetical protein [Bacteroidales bacterium]
MQTTFTIFLRPDQVNSDGTKTVCLRVVQNRRHKLYSLRIFIKEKDWSYKKNQIKKTFILSRFKSYLYLIRIIISVV